jgi:hypothetical protein
MTLKQIWNQYFAINTRINPHSNVTVFEVKNTLTHKTFFFRPQTALQQAFRRGFLCSHLQNYINRKQSSGNRYIFCEYCYGCHWSSRSTTRTLPWDFNSLLSVFSGDLQASFFQNCNCDILSDWCHAGDLRVATSCLTEMLLQSSERVTVWRRSISKT